MKKLFIRTFITSVTFCLGVLAVFIVSLLVQANLDYAPSGTVEHERLITPATKKHQFNATFRACKPGYVQGYETDDGQQLREGSRPVADSTFGTGYDQRIHAAKQTLAYFKPYVDAYGKVGERYILENDSLETERSVTILFYDAEKATSLSTPQHWKSRLSLNNTYSTAISQEVRNIES
jgi:hypothetical protein